VQGYVKSVSSAGAFVALSSSLEARVKLSNLADGYVEKPEEEFPEGKLVRGRVTAVDHNRCGAFSESVKARMLEARLLYPRSSASLVCALL
jgi:ribosomal protein S1